MKSSIADELIAQAESVPGIRAGIAGLGDLLTAPSYHAPQEPWVPRGTDSDRSTEWPPDAQTVLVLGLHHPQGEPRLDWWGGGNTPGNKRLMAVSESLKKWLRERFGLRAAALPYHLERGGVFLKDAAVLAGLGMIGKNNLLLNPDWGPRIRLRAVLVPGAMAPTGALDGFDPCDGCPEPCRTACPRHAFAAGAYSRARCVEQMNADYAARRSADDSVNGRSDGSVTRHCRACELACPVGR